jgi:hypothetical protein
VVLLRIRTLAWLGILGASLLSASCTNPLSFFSTDFLTTLGAQAKVATLPGDAPALLVTVQNDADRPIFTTVSYRTKGGGVERFSSTVEPGEHTSQALICPIEEITMGDVGDLKAVGAEILLDVNGVFTVGVTPTIEVEAFGALLKNQINYDCGDQITFSVQPSGATRSGYRIFAFFQRANTGN